MKILFNQEHTKKKKNNKKKKSKKTKQKTNKPEFVLGSNGLCMLLLGFLRRDKSFVLQGLATLLREKKEPNVFVATLLPTVLKCFGNTL